MFDGLLRFQISEKRANFRFPLNIRKQKVFQLQGGRSSHDPPTRGSAPGPRWRLRPQTPLIGSRSARSPWPPLIAAHQLVENWLSGPRCQKAWTALL